MIPTWLKLNFLVFILTIILPTSAFAWGSIAHRLIADLAYEELTPKAKAEIQSIILAGQGLGVSKCKFGSLEDAAVWPDCVRGHNVSAFRDLRPLHFEDRLLCGSANRSEYCANGACVTAAIVDASAVLSKRSISPADRAIALAEITHFLGDLHQPLHMADNNDRGGNGVPVFYPNHKALTNLHAVWDDALVKAVVGSRGQRPEGVSEQIALHIRQWKSGQVGDWANESHLLAVEYAYGGLPVRQVCGEPGSAPEILDSQYLSRSTPIVEAQLGKAAVRLALMLNAIFR